MSPLCHLMKGIYDRIINAINSTQRNQSTKVRNEICSETTICGLSNCEEYVVKNTYSKPGEQKYEGVFYKIDNKEYKVFLTYCKKVGEK